MRLFGIWRGYLVLTKCEYPKYRKERCKFNKYLLLQSLFEFRSCVRENFFEKFHLEFDKSFNVLSWTNSCFQKQPPEVFYQKAVLKKFTMFPGKHLWESLFFIKLQGLQGIYARHLYKACIYTRNKLLHRLFCKTVSKFKLIRFRIFETVK